MNRLKHFSLGCLLVLSANTFAQKKQVDLYALIHKMSVEEKAGEMTQLDLGVIANGDICNLTQPQSINQEKLSKAIQKYHIGSFLTIPMASVWRLCSRMNNLDFVDRTSIKIGRNTLAIGKIHFGFFYLIVMNKLKCQLV